MLYSTRRVVAGFNKEGKSVVLSDGPTPLALEYGPDKGLMDFWITDGHHIGMERVDQAPVQILPPKGGSTFRFFQVAPQQSVPQGDAEKAFAAAFANIGGSDVRVDTARHPGMHKTPTLDYIVLLKGEVTMLLEEGEVDLKPFDVVVQRATNHAWINKGAEPALMMGVLIDCADSLAATP